MGLTRRQTQKLGRRSGCRWSFSKCRMPRPELEHYHHRTTATTVLWQRPDDLQRTQLRRRWSACTLGSPGGITNRELGGMYGACLNRTAGPRGYYQPSSRPCQSRGARRRKTTLPLSSVNIPLKITA